MTSDRGPAPPTRPSPREDGDDRTTDPDVELRALDPALARDLEARAHLESSPAELASLELAVSEDVARDRGLAGWLSSRSTPVRVGLGALVLFGPAVIEYVARRRANYDELPKGWLAVQAGLLTLALLFAIGVVMRPLHRVALARSQMAAAWALGVLIPPAVSLIPIAGVTAVPPADFWRRALGCFGYGAVLALPALVILYALDRQRHAAWPTALIAAAAGGVCSNFALLLHCPITDPLHVLVGHATLGAFFVLVYLVLYGVFSARAREHSD